MNRLEKCIGALKSIRDYSDPYEVDTDELDYAIDILESLEDAVYKVCKTKSGSPYGSMTEGDNMMSTCWILTAFAISSLKVQESRLNKANMIPIYVYEENTMMILKHDDRMYYLTDEEIELICRCVMSEAGGESPIVQEAVATVIFNRYFSPNFPNTFEEILAPGQFSLHDNGEITNEVRLSVSRAIVYYSSPVLKIVPYNCYYFRADHYHSFGIPYTHIGNTYFSLSEEATD